MMKSQNSREQDIDVSSFDFLDCANVQVRKLGETLLRHIPSRPLSANVDPKGHGIRIISA